MNQQANQIEELFRLVDREVWIVTATADSKRGGLLATWVSEASIDREHPGVLIGIAPNHFTAELIDAGNAFALHLITEAQIGRAWNFAIGSGRERDKLHGLDAKTGATGSPILTDCLAWLDCQVFARLPTGDRTYYWADVVDTSTSRAGVPLTEQRLIELATDEQKAILRSNRAADIALQRPLQQQWREQLPELLRPE